MPYRPITIDALQIGMHVAKLDVAWFRSPFMRHSFLIRTDEQIEKLRRAGVKYLSIDPAKGLDLPGTPASTPNKRNVVVQPSSTPTSSTPEVRSLAAMTQELLTALQPVLCGPDGAWVADYVRLRFAARRPA